MNQKGFAPILILLGIVLAVAIAGGAYYLGKSQFPNYVTQNPVVTSPSPLPSITSVKEGDETANWKTIAIENLNFKIPSTWWNDGPASDTTGTITGAIKGQWININPTKLPIPGDQPPAYEVFYKPNSSFAEVKSELSKDLSDIKESSIQSLKGTLIEGITPAGFLDSRRIKIAIIPSKDNKNVYYLTEVSLIQNHEQYFNQILSTFKFTTN